MHDLKIPKKKAALAGGQTAQRNNHLRIRYNRVKSLSTTIYHPNHRFYLSIGRRIQEKPCNWNVRLRP